MHTFVKSKLVSRPSTMKTVVSVIQRLVFVLLLSSICAGLELDLDVDTSGPAGSKSPCAVLRCEEGTQLAGSSDNQTSLPLKNILSLTVLKVAGSSPQERSLEDTTIASLTSQQPRISRVANAMKVEGVLENGRATIVLEMVKSGDCLADFVCELRTADASGEHSVSSSRVTQHKRRQKGDYQGIESLASWQILRLVHQLDTKLAVANLHTEMLGEQLKALGAKMENLNINMNGFETKMASLDGSVNAKLSLLERSMQKLELKEGAIERSMQNLELKVGALENRIEDKIESSERSLQRDLSHLQNRLEDKLEDGIGGKLKDVDQKWTTFMDEAKSYRRNEKKSLNESFAVCSHNLQEEQTRELSRFKSEWEKLLDNQNSVTTTLESTVKNITQLQTDTSREVQRNMARVVDKINESNDNIRNSLGQDFDLLSQNLHRSFQELASNVTQSSTEILSSANNLFFKTNLTAIAAIENLLLPRRCAKGVISVVSSAVYPYPLIQPRNNSVVEIPHLCDTVTDGGGWIVIQRRTSGDVDFYRRDWEEYKNGFGDLRGDFWLGNEHIHRITNSGPYELRVELKYHGKHAYARYGKFSLENEALSYRLDVGDYSGTAGDSLIRSSQGFKFTTIDRDNDVHSSHNCAERCKGGWWYQTCGHSGLNGKWQEKDYNGPFWTSLAHSNPVSFTEMKIRHLHRY